MGVKADASYGGKEAEMIACASLRSAALAAPEVQGFPVLAR